MGASLLLVLAGCSNKSDKVKGGGTYTPLITGISISTEPAVRGIPNQVTVLVTNVNGLPITYHWKAASGAMTDTTAATATWTPPDTIGTYDLTVSIQAEEGDNHYFKTETYHVYVDNEFERWTRSEAIQMDEAPIPGGGFLYSEIRNNATGESDVWRIDTPGGGSTQLTHGFFSATSPTPRADKAVFDFRAVATGSAGLPGLWQLPWGGGDSTTALLLARANGNDQRSLVCPRFSRTAAYLLYGTDSVGFGYTADYPHPTFREAGALITAPYRLMGVDSTGSIVLGSVGFPFMNWGGPDGNSDGIPDSVIAQGVEFLGLQGNERNIGLYKFASDVELHVNDDPLPFLSDPTAGDPDWSPDGQHIVFTKRNGIAGDRDIWIINAHSSDPASALRVTFGPADDSHPRFSEDGSTIYFISNRADRYGLNGVFGTERRGTNIWSVERFDKP
ncbi:MAG TPA: hypothetical protein VF363_10295 [Candidatus Eisenbacteria bacterium]